MSAVLDYLEIENKNEVLILIDKYEKITKEEFSQTLYDYIGEEKGKFISDFMGIDGSNDEIIEQLKSKNISLSDYIEGINELVRVRKMLQLFNVDEEFYSIVEN